MTTASRAPSGRPRDRRAERREETKADVVAAAWDVVREGGLSSLAMRDLGNRVGMKAQSIYQYFESKNDIYDAMFRDAYRDFAAVVERALEELGAETDGRVVAHRMAHTFFDFCTSDPVRYQLLFQRTIPDFVPSEESWAIALEVYGSVRERLSTMGIDDPEAADLWTAVMTGLTDQQISNDPGGDRWARLVDRAVDMLLAEIAPHLLVPPTEGNRR